MLILTIVQLDITLEFNFISSVFFFNFLFLPIQELVIRSLCLCVCIRRRGQVDLLSFDPKPKRILHRLRREQREA